MGKKVIWQISWKESPRGILLLREEMSVWQVALWMLRNLRRCLIVAVVKIEE